MMDIHFLVKEGDFYHFQLTIKGKESHCFDFELREISAWEMGFEPVIESSEIIAEGFIKWDGCANILFDGGGYAHFCGVDDLRRKNLALMEIYRLAYEHFISSVDCYCTVEDRHEFILGGE